MLGQPVESPHHALGDALTTAKAFIALASKLDAVAPQTVGTPSWRLRRPAPSAAVRQLRAGMILGMRELLLEFLQDAGEVSSWP